MRPFFTLLSLALCAGVSLHAAQFQIGAHNFTLPDGFVIELVAGTNLVPRPIEADFDELGRLYVTDSSGSNDKVEKQLAEKPHRVVRLEDTDGDGRFDKSVVFADKMMLPEGAMWLDGSLYVAAPPSIWKLTDTNNDGVADVRVEWFKGQTLTGCANDLHGPYAGPDGWIYWCKGAFAKQTYTLPNGKEFTTRASHIFRARPDGTGVEPVMTGGMDNPVGLAFTSWGDRILSGTFFQNPEGGKRDGLIHALYGGVYGKQNDVLEGHARTGELLPMMTHLGPAAPAGLMRYESEVFGKEYQHNLFVACFNLHKVVSCIVEGIEATYMTTASDFLVSDNPDFHPTDVLEDADGSLLVVDTGGWYKLCCPTSQLHKPDVLGGIYRIRKVGAQKLEDPRGKKMTWPSLSPDALVALLDDPRPVVQQRAVRQLAALGEPAIPALTQGIANPRRAFNAIQALTRMDGPHARAAVRAAARTRQGDVRMAVIQSIGVWRDTNSFAEAVTGLRSLSGFMVRSAAEALGRLGDQRAVPHLLASTSYFVNSQTQPDRALEHALTYALIELADPVATAKGLTSQVAIRHRIALIALDQMPNGNLQSAQVVPLLTSTNALLKETAQWIIGHRPEWGGEMARWIQEQFKEVSSTAEQAQFADILARSAGQAEVQQRLAEMAARPASQATALSAMTRSRLKEIPDAWTDAVREALDSKWGENNQRLAIAAASSFASAKRKETELNAALLAFAQDEARTKTLRLNALAALPGHAITADSTTFNFLRLSLAADNSLSERSVAASVLAKARWNDVRLLALANSVRSAGPIELPKLLGAFGRATNENVGLALVDALGASQSRAALRAETLKPALTNFPAAVQQKADVLLASLHTDAAQQKQHIDDLLATVKGGDIRRGQALFNSAKAACSACHAIGYLGGNVGPDLTRIGQIRNERDLLEAIVYPSASFVRSFEPMIVATRGGEEYSGVLKKDSAEEVVLATGPNAEQHIARNDVSDLRPGTMSTMPSGLADQLTKEELADLLAFLKATRW